MMKVIMNLFKKKHKVLPFFEWYDKRIQEKFKSENKVEILEDDTYATTGVISTNDEKAYEEYRKLIK